MGNAIMIIGNKRYSSWSLRAWIGAKMLGIPFEERRIVLNQPNTTEKIRAYSPSGLVPAWVEDDLMVHESLAILETLNEVHGQGRLLPAPAGERAQARALSAEMHAGFANIREELPMNLGRTAGPLSTGNAPSKATLAEIAHILTLWESTLSARKTRGPYLLGEIGIVDCMFLPMISRFSTYAVDMTGHPLATAYCKSMLALGHFQDWLAAALLETERIPAEERD